MQAVSAQQSKYARSQERHRAANLSHNLDNSQEYAIGIHSKRLSRDRPCLLPPAYPVPTEHTNVTDDKRSKHRRETAAYDEHEVP